jgi:hypothetical protein
VDDQAAVRQAGARERGRGLVEQAGRRGAGRGFLGAGPLPERGVRGAAEPDDLVEQCLLVAEGRVEAGAPMSMARVTSATVVAS